MKIIKAILRVATILLLSSGLFKYCEANKCIHRYYGHDSTVCVCNATYCDVVHPVKQRSCGEYVAYTSSRDGLRFEKSHGLFEQMAPNNSGILVTINVDEKQQEIHGWGAAFTDSAGININLLNNKAKNKLLKAYFSKTGIEYSMCRVPIGATDFSTMQYSYDDVKDDMHLTQFNLTMQDYTYKIPLIKQAMELTNNTLKLFASAWNPPMWMKTIAQPVGYGFLKKIYYQTWADYYIKFLDAYKANGINFWGLTTGNEPSVVFFPNVNVPSLGWFPWDQTKWIAENLGPTIRGSKYADIKIIIFDDVKSFTILYLSLGAFNRVHNYVDGIGVHGYLPFLPSLLPLLHLTNSDKFILSTESSTGGATFKEKVMLGSWERGEIYATDIIEDLSNWVTGWIEWNLVLDTNGGPNFLKNFADASIIINATSQEFYKQPTYYILGHFSKFISPSSIKISANCNSNLVQVLAFSRLDDAIVIIVYNKRNKSSSITVYDPRRGYFKFHVEKKSINTILYW